VGWILLVKSIIETDGGPDRVVEQLGYSVFGLLSIASSINNRSRRL